jgi:hypothetical protein
MRGDPRRRAWEPLYCRVALMLSYRKFILGAIKISFLVIGPWVDRSCLEGTGMAK